MSDRTERLAAAARDRDVRIAVAESLTCGKLASTVGDGNDAESWFAGGVVAYQVQVKESVLGVEPGIDPCSAECAEQLALGVRELLGVDIAVSTTGVGGPDPQDGHEPGTVYIGWATEDGAGHTRFDLPGGPDRVLDRTVDEAVAILERLVRD